MDNLEKIRQQLINALRGIGPPDPSWVEDIAMAIESLIDEKISGLRDEINQRGIYDPEW